MVANPTKGFHLGFCNSAEYSPLEFTPSDHDNTVLYSLTGRPRLLNQHCSSLDEIGYLPISRTGAMLFFQLMARRYEHASTVLTSNKGFEDWGDIFGDDIMAAALIDRLVNHCHIVTIRGNSYRMRHHSELWQALHSTPEPEPASPRRRRNRQEAPTY